MLVGMMVRPSSKIQKRTDSGLLYNILFIIGQYLLDSGNLVCVAGTRGYFAICACADANIGGHTEDAFLMKSGMAVVNSLGDLRPGSL